MPFWKSNSFRLALGTFISLIFIALAIKDVPLDAVAQAVAGANYVWIALAVGAMLAQSWLRGVRWRWLYFPHHAGLPLTRLWAISTIAQMLNIIFPWRGGEIARVALAGGIAGISRVQTAATLATEKILDTLMLLILLLTIPLFMTLPDFLEKPRESIAALSLLLFAAVFALALARGRVVALLSRFSFRRASLGAHAEIALASLDVFTRWDVHLGLQLLSLAIWVLGVVGNYFVLLALNLALPFVSAVLLMAMLQIGGLVPSSPGKIGVFQYLCILALAIFGVDKSVGLTYGMLLYLVAFGVPIVLGLLFFWWGGFQIQNSKLQIPNS